MEVLYSRTTPLPELAAVLPTASRVPVLSKATELAPTTLMVLASDGVPNDAPPKENSLTLPLAVAPTASLLPALSSATEAPKASPVAREVTSKLLPPVYPLPMVPASTPPPKLPLVNVYSCTAPAASKALVKPLSPGRPTAICVAEPLSATEAPK